MKQGKTEKAVFAKLSTEKVELGKMDELEALLKKAKSAESDMVDAFLEAKASSKRGIKAAEEHLRNRKEIYNLSEDVRAAAQELGVSVSSIKSWKEAYSFLNQNPETATNKMIERMKGLL